MVSIMCVDNDPDILMTYREFLEEQDYDVQLFTDGAEALKEIVKKSADLVLLDMDMSGTPCSDFCRELRKRFKGAKAPAIIISSTDKEAAIAKALSAGANGYIAKPIKSSELLNKVKDAVRRKQVGIKENISVTFGENYEITKKIDGGGQTTVYHGLDTNYVPPREVALKIFKPLSTAKLEEEFKSEQHSKMMFLREAYEWSKFDHPNIVKLFDFGQASGSCFLVLEFVNGGMLWDMVSRTGPIDESQSIAIAYQLAGVLEYIAELNIVHRDIKPNNILISQEEDIKLTDFGLAKQKEDQQITKGNDVFKGTPDFVSPEQIEGQAVIDIQSDVYSLGATLYYAATATLPFSGNSVIETLKNHFAVVPELASAVNSNYGEAYSKILGKMLAKDVSDRFNATELKLSLEELLN